MWSDAEVRETAKRIILSHAEDIENLSISEMLEDLELPISEHEALCERVGDAISEATVTVTWNSGDGAT